MEYLTLQNGLKMPKIMFGSFQMNDQKQINDIVFAATHAGAMGFDTSPSYRSEQDLSVAINCCLDKINDIKRTDFFLSSKIDAWQMIQGKGDIQKFVVATLDKINQPYFDLLLIHWPQPEYFTATWKSFERVYESGLAKSIGICNAKTRHMLLLEKNGANIRPMVVQNEIHPFFTDDEFVIEQQNHGTVIQAYSPLCRMLPQFINNETLILIAQKYNRSVAQVVLRWHLERGIVPIVKTSKVERVHENLSALDFTLDPEDICSISSLNENFKIFLESRCCPGY